MADTFDDIRRALTAARNELRVYKHFAKTRGIGVDSAIAKASDLLEGVDLSALPAPKEPVHKAPNADAARAATSALNDLSSLRANVFKYGTLSFDVVIQLIDELIKQRAAAAAPDSLPLIGAPLLVVRKALTDARDWIAAERSEPLRREITAQLTTAIALTYAAPIAMPAVQRFLEDLREAGKSWTLKYDDGDTNVSERAARLLDALAPPKRIPPKDTTRHVKVQGALGGAEYLTVATDADAAIDRALAAHRESVRTAVMGHLISLIHPVDVMAELERTRAELDGVKGEIGRKVRAMLDTALEGRRAGAAAAPTAKPERPRPWKCAACGTFNDSEPELHSCWKCGQTPPPAPAPPKDQP